MGHEYPVREDGYIFVMGMWVYGGKRLKPPRKKRAKSPRRNSWNIATLVQIYLPPVDSIRDDPPHTRIININKFADIDWIEFMMANYVSLYAAGCQSTLPTIFTDHP